MSLQQILAATGGGVAKLFDSFSTTHLGLWSLQKERTDYTGYAVRADDGATSPLDIGFLADGSFDMATYSAYGTGSEKITVVYDQSGNGFDFTQGTLSLCPIIQASSYNSKPCFFFDTASGTNRMTVSGFTDWNGLADCQFILSWRQPAIVTGYPLIGGSGGRIVNWAAGASNNVYWGESGSARNQYTLNNNGGQLIRFVFEGGNATPADRCQMYNFGSQLTPGVTASHATTFPAETTLDWNGTPLNGSQACNAEYFTFYYIGQSLDNTQVTLIENTLTSRYFNFTSSNLACIGDSLTFGTGLSTPPTDPDTYPNKLDAALEAYTSTTWNTRNLGVPAEQLAVEITNRFSPQILEYRDAPKRNDVVVLWGGTNDLAGSASGGSAIVNTTLAAAVSLCTQAKNAGFGIYFPNILPRQDTDNVNPTFEADRASFNSQITTSLSGIATVVDVAGISQLSDPTNTTYYQADKVHLTAAGYQLVANAVAAVIEPNIA